jgi:hypothetical protein
MSHPPPPTPESTIIRFHRSWWRAEVARNQAWHHYDWHARRFTNPEDKIAYALASSAYESLSQYEETARSAFVRLWLALDASIWEWKTHTHFGAVFHRLAQAYLTGHVARIRYAEIEFRLRHWQANTKPTEAEEWQHVDHLKRLDCLPSFTRVKHR